MPFSARHVFFGWRSHFRQRAAISRNSYKSLWASNRGVNLLSAPHGREYQERLRFERPQIRNPVLEQEEANLVDHTVCTKQPDATGLARSNQRKTCPPMEPRPSLRNHPSHSEGTAPGDAGYSAHIPLLTMTEVALKHVLQSVDLSERCPVSRAWLKTAWKFLRRLPEPVKHRDDFISSACTQRGAKEHHRYRAYIRNVETQVRLRRHTRDYRKRDRSANP
jgi:hypothetical protein